MDLDKTIYVKLRPIMKSNKITLYQFSLETG